MNRLSKFFTVKAQASGLPAQISIRGVIGDTYEDNGWSWTVKNTEDEVLAALKDIPAGTKIDVHVNTEGGDMQCALGIRNAFSLRAADLTFYNDGYMCSSGAILAPTASRVICPQSSFVMIHNPASYFEGDADDAEKAMRALQAHNDVFAGIIAERTEMSKESILALMKAETWWTGEQAVAVGYADDDGSGMESSQGDESPVTARTQKIFARYKNVPEKLRSRITAAKPAETQPPTKPQPTTQSMKNITAALVAAGITGLAADADTEAAILPHITAILAENKRLKTDNEAHVTARKSRVTALVDAAFTDKIIAEARKTSLIALGTASAEGEAEVTAQITDLRTMAATAKTTRGAIPARRGAGEGEENAETRLEEIQAELREPGITATKRSTLTAESLKLRGLDGMFKKTEATRN